VSEGRFDLDTGRCGGRKSSSSRRGSFFGEGALAGQAHRMGSAMAMTNCELLRVNQTVMLQFLQRERSLADLFVARLLAPNQLLHESIQENGFHPSTTAARTVPLSSSTARCSTPSCTILNTFA
jgi:CRP-like cAMP-binding protein